MKIYIGEDAASSLAAHCAETESQGVLVVADPATWAAGGRLVSSALDRARVPNRDFIFPQSALTADTASVFALLAALSPRDRVLAAAGSGTITDLVRFVCSKTDRRFISFPTAPSVDAYASSVVPLVVDGIKRTLPSIAPEAVFADTGVLRASPASMIAAGFGDMICKYTAVADWKLGSLLWDEPYDGDIAARSLESARLTREAVEAIGSAGAEGVGILIRALVDSGLCMASAGHSRSASGTEHHYSHFWEMKLLREGRPPILHGLKVGAATVEAAGLWERVRTLKSGDVAKLIASRPTIPRSIEEESIRTAFGGESDSLIASQERFLDLRGEALESFSRKVVQSWDAVRRIAAIVPGREEIRDALRVAGCPDDPRALGLRETDIEPAITHAHWLRDRFTVRKLMWLLDGR